MRDDCLTTTANHAVKVRAPSLMARMRRTPVTCVRKAQIFVKYRCWKGHMKNIGLKNIYRKCFAEAKTQAGA